MVRTKVADTDTPSLRHSPTTRRYPQRGFSRARRSTRSATAGSSAWRPRPVARYVQCRRISSRCQRNRVAGLTRKMASDRGEQLRQRRENDPVGRGGAGTWDLPTQDQQLVAKDCDLHVLGVRRRARAD
jgi:hypothetical protein